MWGIRGVYSYWNSLPGLQWTGVCVPHFSAVIVSTEKAPSLGWVRWAGGTTVGTGVQGVMARMPSGPPPSPAMAGGRALRAEALGGSPQPWPLAG